MSSSALQFTGGSLVRDSNASEKTQGNAQGNAQEMHRAKIWLKNNNVTKLRKDNEQWCEHYYTIVDICDMTCIKLICDPLVSGWGGIYLH